MRKVVRSDGEDKVPKGQTKQRGDHQDQSSWVALNWYERAHAGLMARKESKAAIGTRKGWTCVVTAVVVVHKLENRSTSWTKTEQRTHAKGLCAVNRSLAYSAEDLVVCPVHRDLGARRWCEHTSQGRAGLASACMASPTASYSDADATVSQAACLLPKHCTLLDVL